MVRGTFTCGLNMCWIKSFLALALSINTLKAVFIDPESPSLSREKRAASTPLKYLWVGEQGQIRFFPGNNPRIMVAATEQTTMIGHYKAALLTSLMTRNMPFDILDRISRNNGSVGVFGANERLSVWDQYAPHRDVPQCRGICSGRCSITCLSDGRKIDELVGMGSQMAVIREDNILCLPQDPYNHRENILVHELAHTINFYLPQRLKNLLKRAYKYAKRYRIWNVRSYAMSNALEYFAEATAAFFMVSRRGSTGDMNKCGIDYCLTEMDARKQMQALDPLLFSVLSEVYTNRNPDIKSKMSTCI